MSEQQATYQVTHKPCFGARHPTCWDTTFKNGCHLCPKQPLCDCVTYINHLGKAFELTPADVLTQSYPEDDKQ